VKASKSILDSIPAAEYVHANMKADFWRLWTHKFAGDSQQLELNLWTRRTGR
jgi:hypothetical protein